LAQNMMIAIQVTLLDWAVVPPSSGIFSTSMTRAVDRATVAEQAARAAAYTQHIGPVIPVVVALPGPGMAVAATAALPPASRPLRLRKGCFGQSSVTPDGSVQRDRWNL
jgi:hypothetical protein